MTRKELNLAIFEGRANGVLWQPRLETWIYHHRENNTLPSQFCDLDNLGIYDALGCSVRYAASVGIVQYNEPEVECSGKQEGTYYIEIIRIPEGELRTVYQDVWEDNKLKNRRIVEFPVKRPEDLHVLTEIINHEQFRADIEEFTKVSHRVGNRAEPTIFLSSSGFTDLIKWRCGLVDTFYLLNDYPQVVEEYLEACSKRDDRMIDAALNLPCKIFNLGDHATNEFSPPAILKRYLIPRWQRISRRMSEHGRFVHSHWDGPARHILSYLRETGLHGVEALTPKPQGDVTLEEIKEAVKDNMVVLDLIPAIIFLPSYSLKEVLDFTRRIIEMFAPRLILGVSDEISQVGEIEKIEAISELIDKRCGHVE